MKRKIIIILLIIGHGILFSQNVEEKCISCVENKVDLKKGASALGTNNISIGDNSLAAGFKNEATGNYSIAMPYLANASGERSLAIGFNARAFGAGSIALGAHSHTTANGTLSVAIGALTSADANYSIVLGFGTVDSPLKNDIDKSLVIGFDSDIPSFFVGPSTETGKPGKIGIGTTEPSELLEVNGNLKVNENAIISTANINTLNVSGQASFTNSIISGISKIIGYNNSLSIQNNSYGTAKIFLSSDGNIGVGTVNPAKLFDVAGTFNATGAATFGSSVGVAGSFQATGAATFGNSVDVAGDSHLNGITLYDDADITGADKIAGFNDLRFSGDSDGGIDMTITADGKVGIGTTTPTGKLDVEGNSHLNGITLYDDADITGADKIVGFNNLRFSGDSDNGTDMFIASDGRIGIGTTDLQTGYLVSIDGQIVAEEVKVQNSAQWYDFVFDDDYNLPKIMQLEGFINQNKHLPDVPSAKEVSEKGINLGEMNGILLKKIEELTLYIIELKKENEDIKLQIAELLKSNKKNNNEE